ncbi:udp-n-acetylglucosamine--dolichyl-phosphate n-acetylglucosaminephosphotransferase-like [Stylonychia lemnae]|uniref:UDP-N-acetylglucosamine--dolichyl-phosphate N-acetylglucosaminephosphotransferase n=1 Tax=Stylonychia lemnae TaxID=5949 RepID=A0A078A883_STYLE|nr:udp-n-acetylglucosamine--dolichyl-phosphate n-acetylglucosaminephosphotransferase-like [Stylonychia lemnae]|eukprot:CDW76986.1 udp-n-acetylglucosamine--dolichyl-phosphate n-acetylglucosaminephosphotransferase-like [Stylonychia lemnae]
MDAEIWQNSKRGFPFNIPLNFIVLTAFGAPFALAVMLLEFEDKHLREVIGITLILSILGYTVSYYAIDSFKQNLETKNLFGIDLNKAGKREEKPKVPEALGLIIGIIFLMITIHEQLLLPTNYKRLVEYNAGLLSICMSILLGFADDVLDLKWRHKLIVPTIATFPIIVAYNGLTNIVVPKLFRFMLGNNIDLGMIYLFYMSMLAVFCTNAINIYAGINGIEVGQSFIIGCFIFIHNVIEIYLKATPQSYDQHIFSISIIVPFLFMTLALLQHNKFPSKVFVGDTFCYFAGMTFAVVGILGHFSKTMLLFFIPQVFNFILSAPQIFGIIHCPRHRLPKFNHETYRLEAIISCCFALFVRYFVSSLFY